jgi:hypothetical protein
MFEGLRLENVDTCYGHLEYWYLGHWGYIMTIWHILCSFGTFFSVWVSFTKKIWQPCWIRNMSFGLENSYFL